MRWLDFRNWHSGQWVEVYSHIGLSKKVLSTTFKLDCSESGNKYQQNINSQHASMINHSPTLISHSLEEGRFITRTEAGHHKQLMEISYP
jgi:hypothetical protein